MTQQLNPLLFVTKLSYLLILSLVSGRHLSQCRSFLQISVSHFPSSQGVKFLHLSVSGVSNSKLTHVAVSLDEDHTYSLLVAKLFFTLFLTRLCDLAVFLLSYPPDLNIACSTILSVFCGVFFLSTTVIFFNFFTPFHLNQNWFHFQTEKPTA